MGMGRSRTPMASSRASRASGASRPSRARASGSYEERREVLDDEQENDHEEEEANNAQQEEVRYALRQTPSRREHSRRHSSLPRSVGRRGSRRSIQDPPFESKSQSNSQARSQLFPIAKTTSSLNCLTAKTKSKYPEMELAHIQTQTKPSTNSQSSMRC